MFLTLADHRLESDRGHDDGAALSGAGASSSSDPPPQPGARVRKNGASSAATACVSAAVLGQLRPSSSPVLTQI